MLFLILAVIAGYFLGSIPGGYIVGKGIKGIDVRKFGSGNIGTTNVLRVLGKKYALLVLLIDLGKGIAAVSLVKLLPGLPDPSLSLIRAVTGLACIGGHNWSPFLRFKGGKGVATSAGVFLILTPLPFLAALFIMILVVAATRYVSLGSMLSAATLPFFIWVFQGREGLTYIITAIVVALLVIARHRSNIKRLFAGQENKLGQKVQGI